MQIILRYIKEKILIEHSIGGLGSKKI